MRFFARRRLVDAGPRDEPRAHVDREALSRPIDLVLHVGMGKTGTSSVQFFLRDNREQLAEHGVLFPATPGRARHTRLGLFARPDDELAGLPEWPRQKQPDPATFRREFQQRLLREIETSGLSKVLFTDEVLFGASEGTLERLGRFADDVGRTTRLVVYLRRQDDHMVSRYQQGVKVGWTKRLDEWAAEDMSDLYDYRARLAKHERLVGPTELVVRRYEPVGFPAGSLFQDFLDAAGINVDAETLSPAEDRNQSLDAESVEFLRVLNLYRVENDAATPGLIDNRRIGRQLSAASSGPVLSLPSDRLDEFMAQWRDTNALVARDFLHESELFRMPRKAAGITTEQRLDPGRLDHFVELLALPDELRGPLRVIAEREAG